MSEMIERVANALFDDWLADEETQKDASQNGSHPRWEDQGEIGRRRFYYAARAALEAMREPTEKMNTAMRIANMNIIGGYGGPGGWEAAIDAALKDD